MPLQATSGAASYDAFGGGVAAVPNYIEEVFGTFLYTGNGATQTITNGIDLSTKGGLVWIKERTRAGTEHSLFDTVRGISSWLTSDQTLAAQTVPAGKAITSFNSNGFSLGPSYYGTENSSGQDIASWTFRKQPKFFDVVTFTTASDGSATVSHNLGSTPGCVITKCTGTTSAWSTWHRSLSGTNYEVRLNSTVAETNIGTWINPSSTQVQFISGTLIGSQTYVAYLFAHNAGGFGLTGTDNVISCGSYTGNGATGNNFVSLGYEPQWVLIKGISNAPRNWMLFDNMRGIPTGGNPALLFPNLTAAESATANYLNVNATGFTLTGNWQDTNNNGETYIYIAIRRGPMKVPTDATKVFAPAIGNNVTVAGTLAYTSGFPTDLLLQKSNKASSAISNQAIDRLRGGILQLQTNTTNAESSQQMNFASNQGVLYDSTSNFTSGIGWNFRRAPSFFDEVCYTGTGANLSVSHNLGMAPQLWIVKGRNGATDWMVGSSLLANTEYLFLNATLAKQTAGGSAMWNSTYPTASTLYLGTASSVNNSASDTYVAYLFATCAGISKVGSITVTAGQQINVNCGFTAGARFVMMKRTDAAGDWMVFDTARGINVGNDPYLLLNSTAAEDSSWDWIAPYSAGFQFRENLYAASSTYIYLAIA